MVPGSRSRHPCLLGPISDDHRSTITIVIAFVPLDADEANAFVEENIQGFLVERLPAEQVTDANAERLRDELRLRLLPDGVLTAGHRFEAIVSEGERVGRIWFGTLDDGSDDVYICDISIAVQHRREGHARAAIEQVVDHARQVGAAQVGLTVTQANTGAIGLYESLGFVTGRSDVTEREMWAAVDGGRRQGVEYTSGCEAIDKADDSNGTMAFPATDPPAAVGFGLSPLT